MSGERWSAALGLQVAGADGKIHSETFADFALSDTVRPLLWERLQLLARNHGLFRVWTEEAAPFWKKDAGFSAPPADTLGRLPEAFGRTRGGWLALRLREESADPNLLEAQFALFRDAERARREKLLQRAEALKMAGTVIAVLLFLFAVWSAGLVCAPRLRTAPRSGVSRAGISPPLPCANGRGVSRRPCARSCALCRC